VRRGDTVIQATHDRFKDRSDFAMVGVSLDGDVSAIKQFCAAHKMECKQVVEPKRVWDNSVARAFEVTAVPLTCVVDKHGIVRAYSHFPGNLEPFVEALLSEHNQAPATGAADPQCQKTQPNISKAPVSRTTVAG
jgi:hypothetical protein